MLIRGVEELLTKPESKIPVYVIPTNEELAIARRDSTFNKVEKADELLR